MRLRLRLTALAAVTSLALTIASAPVNAAEATPEQFIGTWNRHLAERQRDHRDSC